MVTDRKISPLNKKLASSIKQNGEKATVTSHLIPSPTTEEYVPIVAIGASAGGLEAFEEFFTNTSLDTGVAFVLIQHLDPKHKSILGDLIKRYTRMQVYQVQDGMTIDPNCVYIIPPNSDMAVFKDKLHLIEPSAPHGLRLPIDYFFRSLAQDRGERSVCIILSGTGSDGTLGLKAIKGEGGLVMVQRPDSAKYDGMPRSAINTSLADYVLLVSEMPPQLSSYFGNEFKKKKNYSEGKNSLLRPQEHLGKIYILIRDRTGHDFSLYKTNTIIRRIERRMTVNQISNISHYIRYLQQNPLEIDILFREFLIGVTNFFRDSEAFDALSSEVIPLILKEQKVEQPVRIWVPGCSTGEEAYSILMLIRHKMDVANLNFPLQMFATDIDPEAIEIARSGVYPDSIVSDVPAEYLDKYFVKNESSYQVKKSIRDLIVFAVQSLIKDPPFSKLDLVCCRNLLIYLQSLQQQRVLHLFHYSLNENGFLFLGTSETIGDSTDYFSVLNKKAKLFQKKNNVLLSAKALEFTSSLDSMVYLKPETIKKDTIAASKLSYKSLAENILLTSFSPGCILINESGEMLYIHGRTGKYLENHEGQPSLNILNQARHGLKIELATAIRKVLGQKKSVEYQNLKVKTDGEYQFINLTVVPVNHPPALKGMMAVIIEDLATPEIGEQNEALVSSEDQIQRVLELEQELRTTKEYLKSTIEELETSNEELKSTNEELQSSNEELQSTNEELETSKEELQSVNEELHTVNSEHQTKIDDLTRANNDFSNLMAANEIGTLFLDMNLCISRYTPAVTQFINLIEADIGRPIQHIVANLKYDRLTSDIKEVHRTLQSKELEIESEKDKWLLTRIIPYRTLDNVIQGVVITFVDITEQKSRLLAMKKMQLVMDQSSQMVFITDIDGIIEYINPMFSKMTGFTEKETLGRTPTILKSGKQPPDFYQQLWGTIRAGEPWRGELINKNKSGGEYDAYLLINPLINDQGKTTHFVAITENISERKRIEKELSDNKKALKKSASQLEEKENQTLQDLQTNNKLLEDVFASIHMQIAHLDVDFSFVRVNDAFARVHGHPQQYFKGLNYFELFPSEENRKLFQRVLETEEPHYIFARQTAGAHDSSVQHSFWDWTLRPISEKDDKITGIILTMIDVTERELTLRVKSN